jgi:hypothetical protein
VLTPEGKQAAIEEAKEWEEFLEWFDVLYEHSFQKFKYTKGTALEVYLMSNCVPPRSGPFDDEADVNDNEKWKK